MEKSIVSIVKCDDYNSGLVYEAVKKAVELAGGLDFVKDKKVLLKPNLLSPRAPEKAVTTHPEVLRAAIKLVKENGGIPYVGDSSASGTQEVLYKVTKVQEVAEQEGAILGNFKDKVEIEFPDGKAAKKFSISSVYNEVDVIISLPKIKTHALTKYTGAVKNQFGTIPGKIKAQHHTRYPDAKSFSRMLVDLNRFLKPSLAIMDGIWGMEGFGPANGNPKKLGIILASRDLIALDSTVCRIIGLSPEKVWTNVYGEETGLGKMNEEDIEIAGEKLSEVKAKNFKMAHKAMALLVPLPRSIRNKLVEKPYFTHSKCIKCMECVNICPSQPKALSYNRNTEKIDINRDACIRCFCCQETCPVGAIEPKIILFE